MAAESRRSSISECHLESSSLAVQDSSVPTPPIALILTTGSHICRAAIQRNCLVTSISRSGAPANHDTSVTFEKGDIFAPEQYRDVLRGATAVVYSAGMLLEGEYKGLVSGEFDVSKVVGLLGRRTSRNPLEADPKYPRGYNALNRDGGTS